jgi:hypothetical protein
LGSEFEFNFFRYLLLISFIIPGIYLLKNKTSDNYYWKIISPSIAIYSLMEGLRWKRGTDYMYNYDISILKVKSNDLFYDFVAQLLYYLNFPFYVFFILISFALIFSICFLLVDFKKGFIFCVILMYAITMNQSENLMRQYFAISLVIVSIKFLNKSNFKLSLLFFFLSFFSHKSIGIILPFLFIFYLLKFQNLFSIFVINNMNYIFLIIYIFCFIFGKDFSLFIHNKFSSFIYLINLNVDEKYVNNEYLESHISLGDNANVLNSLVNYIRDFLRAIVVLIFGFHIIKPKVYTGIGQIAKVNKFNFIKGNKLTIYYFLSFWALILPILIPNNLESEVFSRLPLNFNVWLYFVEGLILCRILTRNVTFDLTLTLIYTLLVLECIWIFKIQNDPILGHDFIWFNL